MTSTIRRRCGASLLGAAALLCGLTLMSGASRADEKIILKIAKSSDFVPVTPEAGKAWWDSMKKQFEAEHPNVEVQYISIPGSYADLENKMSLLFRSRSTAPDIAEISNLDIGPWVASGYFLKLNHYVASSAWWADFPGSVKAETTLGGDVYAVSHGENTMALFYDYQILAKAGIQTPWQPKTWDDLLAAARKIKATSPKVWPLWVSTGTAQGVFGVETGPGVLLLGSSDPTIFDTTTKKWVVDSVGIRQVIDFYKQASSEGLLAPSSQLLAATAIATPPVEMAKGNIGLTLGGNWFSDQWTKTLCAPCWADASKHIGLANFPTRDGQSPDVASTLGGWDLAIYAKTRHPDLAWQFIDMTQRKENMLSCDIEGGWVPPVKSLASDPEFANFAPPYREQFAKLVVHSVGIPSDPNYPIWAIGMLQATEAAVLNPKISTNDAVQKLVDYVTNQLGPDAVERRK
jgi:multiple sugar transport system substrate-binding protein